MRRGAPVAAAQPTATWPPLRTPCLWPLTCHCRPCATWTTWRPWRALPSTATSRPFTSTTLARRWRPSPPSSVSASREGRQWGRTALRPPVAHHCARPPRLSAQRPGCAPCPACVHARVRACSRGQPRGGKPPVGALPRRLGGAQHLFPRLHRLRQVRRAQDRRAVGHLQIGASTVRTSTSSLFRSRAQRVLSRRPRRTCAVHVPHVAPQGDYRRGHWERLPYDESSMRSIYHVRDFEVHRLMQVRCHHTPRLSWRTPTFRARCPALLSRVLPNGSAPHLPVLRRPTRGPCRTLAGQPDCVVAAALPLLLPQIQQPVDVFLSHDWPTNIALHGDTAALIRRKPFLAKEVRPAHAPALAHPSALPAPRAAACASHRATPCSALLCSVVIARAELRSEDCCPRMRSAAARRLKRARCGGGAAVAAD